MRTTLGWMRASCRTRYGEQASASLGMGSRFCGGRHLRTLVMETSAPVTRMRESRVSSSFPAAPTKGSPCRSSLKPGASPTIMMSAGCGPTPGTAWVLVAWSPHLVQARTSAWSCSRRVGALSDFDACLERDQVASCPDGDHHRLELILRERDQG